MLHVNGLPGYSVLFSGLDGCGKDTQIRLLLERFARDYPHVSCLTTREPGAATKQGLKIRTQLLGEELSTDVRIHLFGEDRQETQEQHDLPAMEEGALLVKNRSFFDSLVYQGYVEGAGIDVVWDYNKEVIDKLIPDCLIYLDINPDVCDARIGKKHNGDIMDREYTAKRNKVRQGYSWALQKLNNRLPKTKIFILWDPVGTMTPDEIHNNLWGVLKPEFEKWQRFEGRIWGEKSSGGVVGVERR